MLKARRCPFCGRAGTLNRHSRLKGNDPVGAQGLVLRGQRVFCSNRGLRGGCGRTFPLLLPQVLARHTFTTPQVWPVLKTLLEAAGSIKAAWESAGAPLSLDGFYHLLQRLRLRLCDLRAALGRLEPPPVTQTKSPLRQTVAHLRSVFPSESDPLAAFHLRVQRSFAG